MSDQPQGASPSAHGRTISSAYRNAEEPGLAPFDVVQFECVPLALPVLAEGNDVPQR